MALKSRASTSFVMFDVVYEDEEAWLAMGGIKQADILSGIEAKLRPYLSRPEPVRVERLADALDIIGAPDRRPADVSVGLRQRAAPSLARSCIDPSCCWRTNRPLACGGVAVSVAP